jgi:hypothetical protein
MASGQFTSEHLVKDHAKGGDVGTLVDVSGPLALLGGHVVGRAEGRLAVGEGEGVVGAIEDLGQSEVGHLESLVALQEKVGGLEVPMDDAEAMSFGEALAEAAEKCDGAELGMSEGAIKVAAHRLRQRSRRHFEQVVLETVDSEGEVAEDPSNGLHGFTALKKILQIRCSGRCEPVELRALWESRSLSGDARGTGRK